MLWPTETKFNFSISILFCWRGSRMGHLVSTADRAGTICMAQYHWGKRGNVYFVNGLLKLVFRSARSRPIQSMFAIQIVRFFLKLRISVVIFFLLSTTPNLEKDINEDILLTSLASVVKAFISLSYQKTTNILSQSYIVSLK